MSIQNSIRYIFRFTGGETKEFLLRFDESTLELSANSDREPPHWAELSLHTCAGCPLDTAVHRYCPTAVHFAWLLDELEGYNSFDEVTVDVVTSARSYRKETSLQEGLGSLFGIIMPTSGCPLLAPFRPMVYFHLPFASLEEVEYRMVSMYLFAQYLRQQNGMSVDWGLDGFHEIYRKVDEVNSAFSRRVSSLSSGDAVKNALIILDCLAKTVPRAMQHVMKDFHTIFAAYIEP